MDCRLGISRGSASYAYMKETSKCSELKNKTLENKQGTML